MKKANLKRSIIISVSLLLAMSGIGWACGWFYDEDEVTFSLFSPEVIHNNDYKPFFRTFHILYSDCEKDNNVSDFNLVNIREWQEFFKNKVDTADLNYLLYSASTQELDTLIFALKKQDTPISNVLKNNSLNRYPDPKTAIEFLHYLGFAKRCEPYASYIEDIWGTPDSKKNPRTKTTEIEKLLKQGTLACESAKNDFIRQRYLFQLVRTFFYGGNFNACIDFFHTHVKELSIDNSTKYRTMGYAAGALFRTKRYAEANYLYSQVYEHSPLLKISAYLSFRPIEEADWRSSLSMASTVHEKNVLWHLLGIYADPLRAMQEIYRTEPASDLLDLLLVRAVNLEEEKFAAHRYNEGGAENDSALGFISKKINPQLFSFIRTIADKGNTHKPQVWNLAAGYLCLASADYEKSEKYLDKALKSSANDTLINKQIKILQIVSYIEQTDKPDKNFENKIVASLNWLKDEKQADLRNANAYEWALKRLSEKYAKHNDFIRSECLDYLRDPGFYNNDAKAAEMMALMDKTNKTEFEKFILSVHPYKKADIIEYQAVQLIYQNKPEEALARFNAAGINGPEVPGDPFSININDCHDCDHANPPKIKFTKASVMEKMIRLRKETDLNGKDAAQACFQLANAWYNISYFGNTRVMYETNITGFNGNNPFNYYDMKPVISSPIIYDCSQALKYYQKAMGLSKNPEFKAKCCFMAAKCEQNHFFMNKSKNFVGDFQSGEYFRQLKANYSKTLYYKEIIKECGYFKTYLALRHG